ncbi:hypothetical protein LXN10_00960 [Arcobacter sp. KX21116]|uniref:hypothetical protein n=1 Tax=Arcobacter iocasae TaxID=2906515 RepID=UPI0035D4EFBB
MKYVIHAIVVQLVVHARKGLEMGFADVTKDTLKKAPGKIFDVVKNIDIRGVIDSFDKILQKQMKKKSDYEIIKLSKQNPDNKYIKEEIRRRGL